MASKPAKTTPYRPRHKRAWVRHYDRRSRFPVPTIATFLLAMPTLRRDDLGRIAERAIDRLDAMDGDADLENATDVEDDFTLSRRAALYAEQVPGCAISEPDSGSYTEWHTREPWVQDRAGPEIATTSRPQDHEDAEDDDPAGQCDEDGLNTFPQVLLYMHHGPGCEISDVGQ